jgi:hypothetical protein
MIRNRQIQGMPYVVPSKVGLKWGSLWVYLTPQWQSTRTGAPAAQMAASCFGVEKR